MPFGAFYQSRYIGFASMIVMAIGAALAIFCLQLEGGGFISEKVLAAAALLIANLISTLLTAIYWYIRRGPTWLTLVLGIQVVVALITLFSPFI